MSKSSLARVLVFVVLIAVGGGLALWKYRANEAAAANTGAYEMAESVEVVSAQMREWRPTAELSGTVIAIESVTLSNEVAGTVREVRFESGAIVEEGDVLLTLDTATEDADLRAIEANVLVNEANVKVAESDERLAEAHLRRLSQAIEARAVSEAEIDQAQTAVEGAKARTQRSRAELAQSRARVDQMKSTIAKKTLKAPFKAMTGLRNVHPGQYLAEGSQVVGLQRVSDKIYLDFALPQEYAARAQPGMVVMANAPMLGDDPVRIEVVALDAVANATTRNVRTRAVIDNPDHKLRPGMFVDVITPVDQAREYVAIPATAVRRASFGDHVFVMGPDEKNPEQTRARQRFVKLGAMVGSDVIILEGLKAGEQVAADGSFKLRDGALVMMGPPPASAPAAAASAEK